MLALRAWPAGRSANLGVQICQTHHTSVTTQRFPRLHDIALADTRDAVHAYARVLGGWLTACRSPRKHWWQASLRPSLRGLTTGVVYAGPGFELELDLKDSQLLARTADGAESVEALHGQAAAELAQHIKDFLLANGLDEQLVPEDARSTNGTEAMTAYSPESADALAGAWSAVAAAMEEFRAGIREETSPIQLWPHHFDLTMAWLPGEKVPGQDPENEEYADKQMGFGFVLGDETIPEPYFYVTAYPLPDAFPSLPLPTGTVWQTTGFNGAVLPYRFLTASRDPRSYLLELWRGLLSAGRSHLLAATNERHSP